MNAPIAEESPRVQEPGHGSNTLCALKEHTYTKKRGLDGDIKQLGVQSACTPSPSWREARMGQLRRRVVKPDH